MSIIKRAECKGPVIVSKTLYSCSVCGHTVVSSDSSPCDKKCPKCKVDMDVHLNSDGQDDDC